MSYISNEYDDLVTAGLLHDIGKFYMRADTTQPEQFTKLDSEDYGTTGAHSKWSSQFIIDKYDENKDIINLILYHHNKSGYKGNKDFINIITKSDSSSAKERDKQEDTKDPVKEPLTSIFSEVSIDDEYKEKWYTDLVELSLDNFESLFPYEHKREAIGAHTLQPKYKTLWNKFNREFDKINNLNDIETIQNILKKYTLYIPSAVYVSEPDISLYDHLRTTAAITSARYNYLLEHGTITRTSDNKENYIVINCSISGIQDFIYKIKTPSNAQRGMAKRLRGRSFYLSLLMETISYYMIKELNLKTTNILFSSGGKFTILAQNSEKTINKINNIQKLVNDYLIETYDSDIYFSLVYQKITDANFENFGEITQKLAQKTNNDKKNKFINHLEKIFEIEKTVYYSKLCSVCGNLTEDNICPTCKEHEELGSKLANSDYMIRYYNDTKIPNSTYFNFLNIGYLFYDKEDNLTSKLNELAKKVQHMDIIRINNTDFLEYSNKINGSNVSFSFKFIGNNIPSYNDENITFEEIASNSKGANNLAIAKMDVDNLGKIFARGLKNASISRVASLSFYLEIFFGGIINKISNKYDVYITYSGGDDLLVIGAYDKIIEFSLELREQFKKYTCYNNSINISAGISIVKPKFPVSKAIQYADDYLEKSKELGKNKITLFDDTIEWYINNENPKIYGLTEVLNYSKQLESYIESEKLSRSLTYSFNTLWSQYFVEEKPDNVNQWENSINKRIRNKKYIPLFKYKLRNIKDEEVFDFLDEGLSKKHYMPWIRIILNWVMLRTR